MYYLNYRRYKLLRYTEFDLEHRLMYDLSVTLWKVLQCKLQMTAENKRIYFSLQEFNTYFSFAIAFLVL